MRGMAVAVASGMQELRIEESAARRQAKIDSNQAVKCTALSECVKNGNVMMQYILNANNYNLIYQILKKKYKYLNLIGEISYALEKFWGRHEPFSRVASGETQEFCDLHLKLYDNDVHARHVSRKKLVSIINELKRPDVMIKIVICQISDPPVGPCQKHIGFPQGTN
ncbi:hypothetical protein Glove_82g75 [Diversispora epigaea]|uniref:Uncharacterized protein n=1 Tax=Diversispora epigaea TaxID=1348612 RepID=A0A397J7W2_9GLOM|nr:hypothetical protein Glove_82g75 [Diversispora epigaea]